jgi:hypothetical protein
MTTTKQAYEQGKKAKKDRRTRVTPFYEEKAVVGGRKVDITRELDAAWLAGYDNEPIPSTERCV